MNNKDALKPVKIIFEDNHLLVVEKPVNLPTQADESGDMDFLTLCKEDLKQRFQKPGNVYLGMVHRLDRPVGGVMVFAKTSKAASRLSEQIRNHGFKKTYLAVVHGIVTSKEETLENYLLKDPGTNRVSVVNRDHPGAKFASLDYQVLEHSVRWSLVRINLHTGRPHQIRVQLSHRGHPLFGDQKYGKDINRKGQQLALWSVEIGLIHPTLKEPVLFSSQPPGTEPWNLFGF